MPFVLIDGSPLAYLSTDGGPLFLISQHLLPFWEGAPIEESEPGEMRDDYWRACELSLATRGWLADLPVGPGTALLLTGGEMQTAWQHTSDGGLLVRWEYGESQEEVAAHVLRLRPSFPWKPTPHVVEATDEPLYVS